MVKTQKRKNKWNDTKPRTKIPTQKGIKPKEEWKRFTSKLKENMVFLTIRYLGNLKRILSDKIRKQNEKKIV